MLYVPGLLRLMKVGVCDSDISTLSKYKFDLYCPITIAFPEKYKHILILIILNICNVKSVTSRTYKDH